MKDVKIEFRKPMYPVNPDLMDYLEKIIVLPIFVFYDDLLRFSDYTPVLDKEGKDTLWLSVYYPEFEHDEIEANLKKFILYCIRMEM
jgi:hypothetical protein